MPECKSTMYANVWFGNITRTKGRITPVRKNPPTLISQNYMLSIKNPFTPYKIVRLNERTRSKNAEQTLADYFFAFFTFDQTSEDHWQTSSWCAEFVSAFQTTC